jgi:hypothetical protein
MRVQDSAPGDEGFCNAIDAKLAVPRRYPMSEPRPKTPRRPDPDDVALIEEIQSLQGEEMPIDQDAFLEPDEIETRRVPTQTEVDDGATIADLDTAEGATATLDGLALDDLREGETDDPKVATEEGLAYVPPSDPPFRVDGEDPEGIEVARAMDDSGELDLTGRIREALEADAATSGYADRLVIGTRGSTVVVRGIVDDVDDSDTIAAVIEAVDGIEEVIDETELADG